MGSVVNINKSKTLGQILKELPKIIDKHDTVVTDMIVIYRHKDGEEFVLLSNSDVVSTIGLLETTKMCVWEMSAMGEDYD